MPRLSKIGAAALGAFGWTGLSSVSASYLQVAGGGGGGGYNNGGGGGAGGYLAGTTSLSLTLSYTVTVGAGGAGGAAVSGIAGRGANGSNSSFGTLTASVGGGGGGCWDGASGGIAGASGGSGGGGGAVSAAGGAATSGQGFAGGTASTNSAGGGGGSSAVGANSPSSTTGGAGGAGTASSISGTSVTYAGGGGGSANTTQGAGGSGGGAAASFSGTAASGTANLGGGGGGVWGGTAGGNGGSGVVIISYLGAQQFGGGIVTTSGGNTIHTFNTSGTLAPISSLSASYLVVAGGGAGGGQVGGGGGAGGYQAGSGVTIDTNSTYLITVGSGGSGTTNTGGSGTNSSFSMVSTASVGGGGGGSSDGNTAPTSGGSGGGSGGFSSLAGGAGTAGQGNAGGIGNFAGQGGAPNYPGGGGGGASAAGANSPSGTVPGSGGAGTASLISGASVTYATGGTGGLYNITNRNGVAGTANTGNGGEGAYATAATGTIGGAGGSGIVIISYAGATQSMAGGTVTISGGNVIHTFTSSGYLTPLKLINNSLRFRSSASAYLSRSVTSTPTSNKWTFSAWVKRGKLSSAANSALVGAYRSSTSVTQIYFMDTDVLRVFSNGSGGNLDYQTTAVYRDPAAWYHIVVSIDNTTSTTAFAMYVNGVQVTSFGTSTNTLGQNNGIAFNLSGGTSYLANCVSTANVNFAYGDLYMAEVNCIDGQALTPNSFGTFNSYGVWQPITYGGSYGTNGFYLPFTNTTSTTTLGYDFSPQGNNWTTNNISLTTGSTYDSMTDVPTLTSATAANYCVFNPLDRGSTNFTLSNGNLTISGASASSATRATMAVSSGKWYWEATPTAIGNGIGVGFAGDSSRFNPATWNAGTYVIYQSDGNKHINGSASAYGAAYTTSDVLGVALDMDAGTITFYKNNTSQGTASTGLTGVYLPVFSQTSGATTGTINANFGQQPFVYTAPSGFVALNTYNI